MFLSNIIRFGEREVEKEVEVEGRTESESTETKEEEWGGVEIEIGRGIKGEGEEEGDSKLRETFGEMEDLILPFWWGADECRLIRFPLLNGECSGLSVSDPLKIKSSVFLFRNKEVEFKISGWLESSDFVRNPLFWFFSEDEFKYKSVTIRGEISEISTVSKLFFFFSEVVRKTDFVLFTELFGEVLKSLLWFVLWSSYLLLSSYFLLSLLLLSLLLLWKMMLL